MFEVLEQHEFAFFLLDTYEDGPITPPFYFVLYPQKQIAIAMYMAIGYYRCHTWCHKEKNSFCDKVQSYFVLQGSLPSD